MWHCQLLPALALVELRQPPQAAAEGARAAVFAQGLQDAEQLPRTPRPGHLQAVETAQAELDNQKATMEYKVSTAKRDAALKGTASISLDAADKSTRDASAAQAAYRSAQVALQLAELNLKRTSVRAPVDGYVTNLHLRKGDYAVAGNASVTLLDVNSFRVTGYFRETQLARIRVGDPVRIGLMGAGNDLSGHVESFGRGIANSNVSSDTQGLPSVDPVFTWVRLAQRIPVRIGIDSIPEGLQLAAGMTASVSVQESSGGK